MAGITEEHQDQHGRTERLLPEEEKEKDANYEV